MIYLGTGFCPSGWNTGHGSFSQFHDAILHEGPMPIEMLRADLEHLPLSPDFHTTWTFYGEHLTHPVPPPPPALKN